MVIQLKTWNVLMNWLLNCCLMRQLDLRDNAKNPEVVCLRLSYSGLRSTFTSRLLLRRSVTGSDLSIQKSYVSLGGWLVVGLCNCFLSASPSSATPQAPETQLKVSVCWSNMNPDSTTCLQLFFRNIVLDRLAVMQERLHPGSGHFISVKQRLPKLK